MNVAMTFKVSETQVIGAPSLDPPINYIKIFLAGTTTNTGPFSHWRNNLITILFTCKIPVTIFNPYNAGWDSTWRSDITCEPFKNQVQWELQKQEDANLIVIVLGPDTDAPISLLELGLCLKALEKDKVVVCHDGYKHKGNVQVVCARYLVPVLYHIQLLAPWIEDWCKAFATKSRSIE